MKVNFEDILEFSYRKPEVDHLGGLFLILTHPGWRLAGKSQRHSHRVSPTTSACSLVGLTCHGQVPV